MKFSATNGFLNIKDTSLVEIAGERKSPKEWSDYFGIPVMSLKTDGWSSWILVLTERLTINQFLKKWS